jgi:hypothetical protein
MSRDQNAGQNVYIQIGNESFETVEQFKYLGTTLTNQNSIHEEIKSILKSSNACCHSVQNLLSSSLLYLQEVGCGAWTGSMWLRIGTGGGLLWMR